MVQDDSEMGVKWIHFVNCHFTLLLKLECPCPFNTLSTDKQCVLKKKKVKTFLSV